MKHSTGKPTKAEAARMARLKNMGCIVCPPWAQGGITEIHHLIRGNKRRGHMFTIPLCSWHHRAVINGDQWPEARTIAPIKLGPSLADGSKPFHAAFGTDDELLAITNNRLLEINDARRT